MSLLANLKPVAPDLLVRSMRPLADLSRPHTVNLGVGVYYDDQRKLPVLEAVMAAEDPLQALQSPACSILQRGTRGSSASRIRELSLFVD